MLLVVYGLFHKKREQKLSAMKSNTRKDTNATVCNVDPVSLLSNIENVNANVVSPEKNSGKRVAEFNDVYYSYEMKNGLDDSHLQGKDEADAFLKEYKDVIHKEHIFHTKDEWVAHQSKRAKIMADKPKPTIDGNVGTDEAKARLIVDSISTNTTRNVDRIEAFYKTTSHSTKAVLIIRFLNQHNNDAWVWKPSYMLDIITNYVNRVKSTEDPVLAEAFSNLTYGKQSDDESSDKEKVKTVVYKPPNSSQSYNIEYYTGYTYVTIPHEELNSDEDEANWVTSKATLFLENIQQIMSLDIFRISLTMIKKDFADKLYDDRKRSTLPKFLSSAVIRVSPIVFLTDHVIQATANEITGHHYNNRLSTKKYNSPVNKDNTESSINK